MSLVKSIQRDKMMNRKEKIIMLASDFVFLVICIQVGFIMNTHTLIKSVSLMKCIQFGKTGVSLMICIHI